MVHFTVYVTLLTVEYFHSSTKMKKHASSGVLQNKNGDNHLEERHPALSI